MQASHRDLLSSRHQRPPSLLLCAGIILTAIGFERAASAQGEDCNTTAEIIDQFDYAIIRDEKDQPQVGAKVKKQIDDASATPGGVVLSCVRLKVLRVKTSTPLPDVLAWHPFIPKDIAEAERASYWQNHGEKFRTECERSSCANVGAVASLLKELCMERGGSEKSCSNRPPQGLSTTRKVVGWSLVGAGTIAVILGAVNLGIPIAKGSGCTDYGLELPCVADRRILSGLLLGLGIGSIGGGALTLTLPVGGRK